MFVFGDEFHPPQNSDRHRQVERRPFLLHIRRREIDQQGMGGKRVTRIEDRPPDAFDRFLDRRLRESDQGGLGQSVIGDIHLDFAPQRVDPDQDERIDLGQHRRESTIARIRAAKIA